MARYTYLFAHTRTNAILAELPVQGATFDRKLNGIGAFSGTVPLGDPRITALDPITATEPVRQCVYVDRDGVIVWGGIIWTRRITSGGQLEISAAEFPSLWEHVVIYRGLLYTGLDQLVIARALIAEAQAGVGVPLTVGTETSGVLRDREYSATCNKPIAEAVNELSMVINGFDYAVNVAYEGTPPVPVRRLRLGYPRIGTTARNSGLMFELPGNISSFSYSEDGTRFAVSVRAIGGTVNNLPLVSTASRMVLYDAGYPALIMGTSYTDVVVQSTLDAHAAADIAAFSEPVKILSIDVRGDSDPQLGSYIPGDECRVRITDGARFPAPATEGGAGLDTTYRIIAISVSPPGPSSAERVSLTLGPALP